MEARPIRAARSRRLAVAASLAAHAGVLALLLGARASQPAYAPAEAPPPMPVMLVEPPPPPPPLAAAPALPAGPPRPSPPTPAAPPPKVRPARLPPAEVAPLLVDTAPTPEPMPTLGDGELAGARTAGSGGAGGGGTGEGGQACDMVRRLQSALRRDREVQAAAAQAHRSAGGRALLVWNGDWLRSPGEAGKGLAGIRQAIALEVAFAPEACRAEPMRGLVLIALADSPGAPRLALGSGQWRWSDLLHARGAMVSRR